MDNAQLKKRLQTGVSLIEVVLVIFIIFFLVLLISNIPSSLSAINSSRHMSTAKNIASQKIEFLRKLTYANLAEGSNTFTNIDLASLPKAEASYEITPCPVEICTLSEEAKKIKVTVSWMEAEDNRKVELETIISEGGIGQ